MFLEMILLKDSFVWWKVAAGNISCLRTTEPSAVAPDPKSSFNLICLKTSLQ